MYLRVFFADTQTVMMRPKTNNLFILPQLTSTTGVQTSAYMAAKTHTYTQAHRRLSTPTF